ncbi:hypothetical protein BpHYR1_027554 [Brachionus plicatilis]|uniref:Uncharacterized protein n=1 Tax=Brachionus plicatilis TaxID=10195 RepID=A0A3M7SNZ4_BRAPC|nr:hypothetical protein BpHYR1_027554 [Brachionus plicatilis]
MRFLQLKKYFLNPLIKSIFDLNFFKLIFCRIQIFDLSNLNFSELSILEFYSIFSLYFDSNFQRMGLKSKEKTPPTNMNWTD